ncbi:MAG TPA: deoxyribodipyrimidine photo-lyase [Bacteroidales bacterium]|nr:deoxyribodipyrimidine photo-lyase [Bacteroidales bacterium]
MNNARIRLYKDGIPDKGPVVYWMSRDQRAQDNWALIFADMLARENKRPLVVLFHLLPAFAGASMRHYRFMLEGLKKLELLFNDQGIAFTVTTGENGLIYFLQKMQAGFLVTDFDPLRVKRLWKQKTVATLSIPVYEVDAHNIVPCWVASGKQEYGAYTLRPKIQRLLPLFLEPFPLIEEQKYSFRFSEPPDWEMLSSVVQAVSNGPDIQHIMPGEEEATKGLQIFLENGLSGYEEKRNDPCEAGTSGFSPWLHFGHISAQRIALEILKQVPKIPGTDAFLEQLIIRRELADNYCFYNPMYDRFEGFPEWAKSTLNKHRNDEREYLYSEEEFENANTHDALWNAAQTEMVLTGKMHNSMRMYWAKKILEWTSSPEEALRIAIKLNDKYELDGRDPNGYTGCAWAIGGVHDRPWGERPVYGTIRYMNDRGAAAKFNVKQYIRKVNNLKFLTDNQSKLL